MAQIEPFCGIRYSLEAGTDISRNIAPPYDVLSERDKQDLLAKSEHNIVAIDLPHTPPKKAGPVEAYENSAKLLTSWLDENILIREDEPVVYIYQQRFMYQDKEYCRRGFIARLRLEEFGEGSVFPHEQTYGGPKEDRLMLTKHTKTNISQVFCLFDDPENRVTNSLYNHVTYKPTYTGKLNDVVNEVWTLSDRELCNWITQSMKDKKIFIADGHHRYGTSLMYREYLREKGKLTDSHPANYVGCVFVSMSEPGLAVLPTHRCIMEMDELNLEELAEVLSDKFEIKWLDNISTGDELEKSAGEFDPLAMSFLYHGKSRVFLAKPKDPDHLLDDVADDYVIDWRRLPVSVLHHYVLNKIIYPKWLKKEKPSIEYLHLADETVDFVNKTPATLGILVPATPIEAVRNISLAGQLMPQKSTFFFPKLATGLVMHPLFE